MGHFIAQLPHGLNSSKDCPVTCFGNSSVTYSKYLTSLGVVVETFACSGV